MSHREDLPGFLPPPARRCRMCRAAMSPVYTYSHPDADPEAAPVPVAVTGYGYKGESFFCTLTCGYEFAVGAIRLSKLPVPKG